MSGANVLDKIKQAANRSGLLKDPGNAGTIKAIRSPMAVNLVSVAAETRTLARPSSIGQELLLHFKTDGGDITLTVTGGFNEDGDTSFTFSDAGQFLLVKGATDGSTFFWRKIADYSTANLTPTEAAILDGATLTTAQLNFLSGVVAGTPAVSKALVLNANLGLGAIRQEGLNLKTQAAPAAKTTTSTLTIAEMLTGIVTGNQGAAGAATYTTDTGAAIETGLIAAYPNLQNNDSFDFVLINTSTVGAEDITIAAGASGVTLVGKMTVESNAAVTDDARGVFRVRRTAQNVYTIYRVG